MTELRNQHEEETRITDTDFINYQETSVPIQGGVGHTEQNSVHDTSRTNSQSVVEISDAEEDNHSEETHAQTSGYLSSKASLRRSRVQQRLLEDSRERGNESHAPNRKSRRGHRPQRDRVGLFTNADGLNRLTDTSNEVEIVREIVFQHNVNQTENREFDPSLVTADNREVIDLEVNDSSSGDVSEVEQRDQTQQRINGNEQQESDIDDEDMEILQQTNTINTNTLPEDVMTNSNYIQIQLPGNNSMYVYDRNGSMQRDRASFESTMLRNFEHERSHGYMQQRHLRRLNRAAERQRNQLMHVSRRATDSILLSENEGLFLVDDDQNLQSVNTAEPASRFQPITAANSQVVTTGGTSMRDSSAANAPMSVRRLRQQLATQRRMQLMQQRRAQQMLQRASGHADLEVNNELTDVREKIGRYPDATKKAFDECETLFTFQQTVNRTMPAGATEAIKNLRNLFMRYRSIRGNSRLQEYAQSAATLARSSEVQNRRAYRRSRHEAGSATREAGRDYMRIRRNMGLGQSAAVAMHGHDHDDGDNSDNDGAASTRSYLESGYFTPMFGNEEETTRSIIQMIERREAAERSALTTKFSESTESQKSRIYGKAEKLPPGYTSSFSSALLMDEGKQLNNTTPHVNKDNKACAPQITEGYEKVPICVLCGVELGVGIPADFVGKRSIDQSFEYMVEKYGVACPYQTLTRPTDYDRECSKRCFIAKPCGHVFCGRCVLRVNHATRLSAGAKKSMSRFRGPSNPNNYGPNTCVGENCHVKLRKKGAFQEVFL
ncbi:hypothetical protein ACO0QE_001427 [Hanseniaspora vineae]